MPRVNNQHSTSIWKFVVVAVISFLLGVFFSYIEFSKSSRLQGNGTASNTEKNATRCCKGIDNQRDKSLNPGLDIQKDKILEQLEDKLYINLQLHNENEPLHQGGNEVAKQLYHKVRVLCLVVTHPPNHHRVKHIKATWGKRCNVLLFMSTKENKTLSTIALPVAEGQDHIWGKVKESFKYVYKNNLDSVDWVFKVDDDAYVIMENLRYLLSDYNPSEAVYFGHSSKSPISGPNEACIHGGAGYVLSKEAVKRLVEGMDKKDVTCRKDDGGSDDIEVSVCLESLEVKQIDSDDRLGRHRFFHFPLVNLFLSDCLPNCWQMEFQLYQQPRGFQCCSDLAVSFHYFRPLDLYIMEYFVYHLHAHGVTFNTDARLNHLDASKPEFTTIIGSLASSLYTDSITSYKDATIILPTNNEPNFNEVENFVSGNNSTNKEMSFGL